MHPPTLSERFLGSAVHRRVAAAIIAFSLAGIVVTGTISYFAMRGILTRNLRFAAAAEARLEAERLGGVLNALHGSLSTLSASPLLMNAIIDTSGSKAYVEPFLRSFRLHEDVPASLTLCDFRGDPIWTNLARPSPYKDEELVRTTVGRGVPFARVAPGTDGSGYGRLLLAYPLLWNMTGRAEGMVVAELSLRDVVGHALPPSGSEGRGGVALLLSGAPVYSDLAANGAVAARQRVPLRPEGPLGGLALSLEVGYRRPGEFGWLVPACLFVAVILVGLSTFYSRRISLQITSPLRTLTGVALYVAESGSLDISAPVEGGDEEKAMARSFNRMIDRVRSARESLETRVGERTAELSKANEELSRSNREKEELVRELQETLANVRALRGLLPICSHCKKIRDDGGYWNQLESYIRIHSDAEFSHGICPDCMERMYGELGKGD